MNVLQRHALHPYFAKYDYSIPLRFIESFTQPLDVVLDPFAGSGTTLLAANHLRRAGIGVDANPLACLIMRVKTCRLSDDQFQTLSRIRAEVLDLHDLHVGNPRLIPSELAGRRREPAPAPGIHNFEYWFVPHIVSELREIKAVLDSVEDSVARDAAYLAFSRIIIKCSNQQGESVYRRVAKDHPRGYASAAYTDALTKLMGSLKTRSESTSIRVIEGDARSLRLDESSVDLVVTSPPYLNAWDYGLYQRFRLAWLGFDPKKYEHVEIGKHLRTLRDGPAEIERFRIDMEAVFETLAFEMKSASHAVFVNGESVVEGNRINTDGILIDAAARSGLALVGKEAQRILGPHFGNHASLSARGVKSRVIEHKNESLLVFQKKRKAS